MRYAYFLSANNKQTHSAPFYYGTIIFYIISILLSRIIKQKITNDNYKLKVNVIIFTFFYTNFSIYTAFFNCKLLKWKNFC